MTTFARWCRSTRRIMATVVVVSVAACTSAPTAPVPSTPEATTSAPLVAQPALFYTKAGSLYISDPAGTTGRRLTSGPADTQPAPSPDLSHVAFVRKSNASDLGGELWILDLSPAREPAGKPRRLVDPAALAPTFGDAPTQVMNPRWSPTGDLIAFLETGEGGGFLRVAAAGTGEVLPAQPRLFADDGYAWAPDGRHIAWTGGRSDVSPVDVSILAVGATSTPVVPDTDAFSVTYDRVGQAILFANGDASVVPDIPFALRKGGIYSVATPDGGPANPPAPPTLVYSGPRAYGDIAALASGAIAFTEWSENGSSRSIQMVDAGSSQSPTKVADAAADGPWPAWGAGDIVAYLGISPAGVLMVTDVNSPTPRQVDTDVDAYAWPPQAPG